MENDKIKSFEDRIAEIRKKAPQYVAQYADYGKLPPQATDIEGRLLGVLILKPESMKSVPKWLHAEMMYREEHKVILTAIQEMTDANIPVDQLTLRQYLVTNEMIEYVGGAYYISELCNIGVGAPMSNILYWCRILAEKFIFRDIIRIAHMMQTDAFDDKISDPFELLETAIDALSELDVRNEGTEYFDDVYDNTVNLIEASRDGNSPYYKTGYLTLDALLKLTSNRILMIAALAKQGKTKFLINIIIRMIKREPKLKFQWYSYEVSNVDILMQMIAYFTGLNDDQLKSIGYVHTKDDIELINKAKAYFKSFPIEYNSKDNHIDTVCRNFERYCKLNSKNECVLVIDNIGGLEAPGKSRTEQDDYIAGKLVTLRNKTGATVIVVHHLKKEAGFNANFETGYQPLVEHIRGSGRFKDFVNIVALINYPNAYPDIVLNEKARRPDKMLDENTHLIEKLFLVDVALTRHGKTGLARFICNLSINRFKEYKK